MAALAFPFRDNIEFARGGQDNNAMVLVTRHEDNSLTYFWVGMPWALFLVSDEIDILSIMDTLPWPVIAVDYHYYQRCYEFALCEFLAFNN